MDYSDHNWNRYKQQKTYSMGIYSGIGTNSGMPIDYNSLSSPLPISDDFSFKRRAFRPHI